MEIEKVECLQSLFAELYHTQGQTSVSQQEGSQVPSLMNASLYALMSSMDQEVVQDPLEPERSPSFQMCTVRSESLDPNDVNPRFIEGHPVNVDYIAHLLRPVFACVSNPQPNFIGVITIPSERLVVNK